LENQGREFDRGANLTARAIPQAPKTKKQKDGIAFVALGTEKFDFRTATNLSCFLTKCSKANSDYRITTQECNNEARGSGIIFRSDHWES
jgi:hypothetical protein